MPNPTPDNLTRTVHEMVAAFRRFDIAYALVGGIAASYRSRPRFTKDIDFLLEIPQIVLPRLLDDLQARGFEFDTHLVIHQWTQEHMTVLSYGGVRIDWLKPIVPLYRHVLDTAQSEDWDGAVRIATPEGLILLKLPAFRLQDQLDIESLLSSNPGKLNLGWIRSEWQSLAELNDPRMLWFEKKVQEVYRA